MHSCRFQPLGCRFSHSHLANVVTHEQEEDAHASILTFTSIFHLLGEHRALKQQLMSAYTSEPSSSLPSSLPSSPALPSAASSVCSVPFVRDPHVFVSILSTTVYADQSDADTFPHHLVEEKSNVRFGTYRPLKYPSLVVENGIHNSIVSVRVRTNDWSGLQVGWMNHHGTYLRRLIPGTRLSVSDLSRSEEGLLFEDVKIDVQSQKEEVYEAEISLRVRDMTGQNRFEGHYRDLRIVGLCLSENEMNQPVIRAYDVGVVMRTSPNASYLSAKRVPTTEVELGWNLPPVLPPMMGVRPTMRIDWDHDQPSPSKKPKCQRSLDFSENHA
jgi:hypothetical protein